MAACFINDVRPWTELLLNPILSVINVQNRSSFSLEIVHNLLNKVNKSHVPSKFQNWFFFSRKKNSIKRIQQELLSLRILYGRIVCVPRLLSVVVGLMFFKNGHKSVLFNTELKIAKT